MTEIDRLLSLWSLCRIEQCINDVRGWMVDNRRNVIDNNTVALVLCYIHATPQSSELQHHSGQHWRLRHNAKSYWPKHRRYIWHRNVNNQLCKAHPRVVLPSKSKKHCGDTIMPHPESRSSPCIYSLFIYGIDCEMPPISTPRLPNIKVRKTTKCCRSASGQLVPWSYAFSTQSCYWVSCKTRTGATLCHWPTRTKNRRISS